MTVEMGIGARHREGNASIVHIAEAYLDYEKSCILGVYDTDHQARKRIYAVNEDREKWGFNRYAISSWMTGETLPSHKLWLYPAGGTLIEQSD
ncbi:MAG TPA: hypothetical protein VFR27_13575 [Mycobacterium sp.]|nr:hypothetical protein [Mycobacterium sp.]